jgi:Flp pilus assembly protein CpaB
VKADEIFILLLIVVCVGAIAALAVHSRRQEKAPDAQDPQIEDKTMMSPGRIDEERTEPRHHRKKRRR